MTADKLAMIADLPEGELRGWWLAVFSWGIREPKPGERAALLARAKELRLPIKGTGDK